MYMHVNTRERESEILFVWLVLVVQFSGYSEDLTVEELPSRVQVMT
jgi:hypothetical protein